MDQRSFLIFKWFLGVCRYVCRIGHSQFLKNLGDSLLEMLKNRLERHFVIIEDHTSYTYIYKVEFKVKCLLLLWGSSRIDA
jgi:hypothetical protein